MTQGNENKNTPEQLRFIEEAQQLTKANRLLTVRLLLASAFHSMWIKAYDALLTHGIKVRELPEYKDSKLLDRALDADLEHGQGHIIEYIKRVESGISAAIRRKSMRKV